MKLIIELYLSERRKSNRQPRPE